jgi:CMP-N,N'-diacetyllegionaminic acid synthase
MQIAALLTGRGNNTLKNKNILKVLGKPLLAYPCLAAKRSKYINSFWTSSDCEDILQKSLELDFKSILRPKELALPSSQHIDAINHALKEMAKHSCHPNIVVVMMANSVTIKTEWIDECIQMLINNKDATAAVPVYREFDHNPYRCKKINTEGYLDTFFDFSSENVSTNRQDLQASYFLSHNFWVLNLDSLGRNIGQKPWTFMGDKVMPLLVEDAFDVHSIEDLERSKVWLMKNPVV